MENISKIISIGLFLAGGISNADVICSSVKQCQEIRKNQERIIEQIDERIEMLQFNLRVGDVLKDQDGNIRYMTYEEALGACQSGSRLPTVREFSKMAKSFGAKGAEKYEVVLPFYDKTVLGWVLVDTRNPNEERDTFFYNKNGYQKPENDPGVPLWSSSLDAVYGHLGWSYSFDSQTGSIGTGSPHMGKTAFELAVRCITDK